MSGPADIGRLLMVGCGNMGGAMLRRWLDAGLDPAVVTVISPSGRALPKGVRVVPRYEGDREYDTVVLAMKPQQLAALHNSALAALRPALLVSILAGVELATLKGTWISGATVRAMPNLPVGIGRGVVALHGSPGAPRAIVDAMMAPLGLVEWIDDEALFDLVTALAGSGPAFLFRFIDALARAGAGLGLAEDQARRLALATVAGSAAMAAAADEPPAALAERVASPGGSTRKGLDMLDRDDALVALLRATLAASAQRNAELAAVARGPAPGDQPPSHRA